MENQLRLGQFRTERRGATFEEVWTDGYAFAEIAKWVLSKNGLSLDY